MLGSTFKVVAWFALLYFGIQSPAKAECLGLCEAGLKARLAYKIDKAIQIQKLQPVPLSLGDAAKLTEIATYFETHPIEVQEILVRELLQVSDNEMSQVLDFLFHHPAFLEKGEMKHATHCRQTVLFTVPREYSLTVEHPGLMDCLLMISLSEKNDATLPQVARAVQKILVQFDKNSVGKVRDVLFRHPVSDAVSLLADGFSEKQWQQKVDRVIDLLSKNQWYQVNSKSVLHDSSGAVSLALADPGDEESIRELEEKLQARGLSVLLKRSSVQEMVEVVQWLTISGMSMREFLNIAEVGFDHFQFSVGVRRIEPSLKDLLALAHIYRESSEQFARVVAALDLVWDRLVSEHEKGGELYWKAYPQLSDALPFVVN